MNWSILKRIAFLLPFSLLHFYSTCLSVIVADLDVVDFPYTLHRQNVYLNNGLSDPLSNPSNRETISLSRHVRIAFFNTKTQQFIDSVGSSIQSQNPHRVITYFSMPGINLLFPPEYELSYPGWFKVKFDWNGQHLIPCVDFSLFQSDFMISKIVRCNGKVLNTDERHLIGVRGSQDGTRPQLVTYGSVVSNDPLPSYYSFQEIGSFLSQFQMREKETNRKLGALYFFPDYTDNYQIKLGRTIGGFGKTEKGRIGELAADITMQTLGFIKKDGKYGGRKDNGFDGVYFRPDINVLYLSDSKFHDATPSLDSVERDICANINFRLKNLKGDGSELQKQTATFINDFRNNNPHRLYILPYVLISDGCVKARSRSIDAARILIDPLNGLGSAFEALIINDQVLGKTNIEGASTITSLQQLTDSTAPLQQIQLIMQTYGLDTTYQIIPKNELWNPVTVQSIRNPLVRLKGERLEIFEDYLSKISLLAKKEEIKKSLGEIADIEHQYQVMEHIQAILGCSEDNTHTDIINQLSWLIGTLSSILTPRNYKDACQLIERICATRYPEIAIQDDDTFKCHQFELKDRLVIFEAFLKSQYFSDKSNWDNNLFLYHKILASLYNMEIDLDVIEAYLTDFVQILRIHPLKDLSKIFNQVKDFYDLNCFNSLKGCHTCEDWVLLVKILQKLPDDDGNLIINFSEHFPDSFEFGPADAVKEVFLPLLPSIRILENDELLDTTDQYVREAFNFYTYQEAQRVALEEIIFGVLNQNPKNKIFNNIQERILKISTR